MFAVANICKQLILGTVPSKHKHKRFLLKTVAHQPGKFETALRNSCLTTDGTGILITGLLMVNLYIIYGESHTILYYSNVALSQCKDHLWFILGNFCTYKTAILLFHWKSLVPKILSLFNNWQERSSPLWGQS